MMLAKLPIYKLTFSHANSLNLMVRVIVGVIFVAHGGQKLFGLWGGHGLEGTAQFMGSLGLEPAMLMAFLAAAAEFFGGLALIVGLLVRPAAASLAVTMIVAGLTVHFSKGFFLSGGGYEYVLLLLVLCLGLTWSGAGALSLDRMISQKIWQS